MSFFTRLFPSKLHRNSYEEHNEKKDSEHLSKTDQEHHHLKDHFYHHHVLIESDLALQDSLSTSTSASLSTKSNPKPNNSTMSFHPIPLQSQNAAVQEPTRPTTDRETGFPEPLSPDRNTTLPHPSADTSPNATIIAPDLVRRSHSRSRSFLRNHSHSHKSTKSQEIANGTVTALPYDESKMYEGLQYTDSRGEVGGGSLNGESSSGEGRTSGSDRDETGDANEGKRKGVLRKMRLHKS